MNFRLSRFCVSCTINITKNINTGSVTSGANFSTGKLIYSHDGKEIAKVSPQKKRKEILRMPESELEGYAIGVAKPPLMDRRGETQSIYRQIIDNDSKSNKVDFLSWLQTDIDVRPTSLKRWWLSVDAEYEMKIQSYNPRRDKILGSDLSAAHFILSRKGKIRFKGHSEWITKYRKDAVIGTEEEEDLPAMTFELCTVPTKYDPRFRLEAIDAAHMTLIYEGLSNLENLDYVNWLSFRGCPHIDDWCMDKIYRLFSEKLEYLDISGCQNITDRSIGAVHRCSKLKTLVVEDMEHVSELAVICAQLEDDMPELTVIGVDYQTHLLQMRQRNEVEKLKELKANIELEANTITVESSDETENVQEISSVKANK